MLSTVFLLWYVTLSEASIYLYDSEDSSLVQVYDCLHHDAIYYCRRPLEPIILQRSPKNWHCHQGSRYSFEFLRQNNITTNEVLHGWKSTLDRAEEYAYYLNHSKEINSTEKYICNCTVEGTFGKHCEYSLPTGVTFEEIIAAKFVNQKTKLNYEGDIVCYKTLECDSGLLCLDWRDICDGRQQCMFGLDEENCDKLEFNECAKDEYRCMNGMCIPDRYFLDGEFDCLDLSDEKASLKDSDCPFLAPSFQCDDKLCPPCVQICGTSSCSRRCWTCGDGQCIYQKIIITLELIETSSCLNRRDQFFWCETIENEGLWTLNNGRCTKNKTFDEHNINDYCHYLQICQLSNNKKDSCPCSISRSNSCLNLFQKFCLSWNITHYPDGGLLAPYIFGYYNDMFHLSLRNAKWQLNGFIKCRGYIGQLLFQTNGYDVGRILHNLGPFCTSPFNRSEISKQGYDKFCHNDSRTFKNDSYHFIDVCRKTKSCISAYRISDGFDNCLQEDEHIPNELATASCTNVRNHRFQCSINQSTCLYVSFLGDYHSICQNQNDEYWMDTYIPISQINCNQHESKVGCSILRQYIKASLNLTLFNNDYVNSFSNKQIPFRSYCDTYPDLSSRDDENSSLCQIYWICLPGQWQCSSGHCIPLTSMFNSIFDCPDGSDEQNMFASNNYRLNYNYPWVNMSDIVNTFHAIYPSTNLWSICHSAGKSPCSDENNTRFPSANQFCSDSITLKNENITCPIECDESSIINHCYLSLRALGYDLRCLSMKTCVALSYRFQHSCRNASTFPLPCKMTDQYGNALPSSEFKCWSTGNIVSRCFPWSNCPYKEDEYMCVQRGSSISPTERKIKFDFQTMPKQLHLLLYPPNAITIEHELSLLTNQSNSNQHKVTRSQHDHSIFNWCNRGIGIRLINDSIVCFCSPHYHGDQCQYHTDRLSFVCHVNFTHSKYSIDTDPSIVNKYLVLFLYDDLVLSIDEFHLRPVNEFDHSTKQRLYLHYSHSSQAIKQKRQRYFNRSNIVHSHPYSIRIEACELKSNKKAQRFAIWEYPIYFDFIPVYRFAEILRFFDPKNNTNNPCQKNPCTANEQCYQLQNQPSQYKCLCQPHYYGPNCTQLNQICLKDYCSSDAICQPDYRGLTQGKEWPYCICPLNSMGQRCLLKSNVCEKKPCQNNGTCYQVSRPDQFICICTEEFRGERCEEKKPLINFHLEEKSRFNYEGSVVQYFSLDLVQLELRLAHKDVYSTLPLQLRYYHYDQILPEVSLLQLHSLDGEQIYLLGVQLNRTSLIANVSINKDNQCQYIRSLISPNQSISVIEYHLLCQHNARLVCFHDDSYLCICNENGLGVECFLHQHEPHKCDECKANAKCLKGSKKGIVCICPLCRTGNRCQFSLESFSFTLDQLFFNDLQSSSTTIKHATLVSLIVIPVLLFLVGLINNLCCFVTFRQKRCRCNGIGEYLFCMSIVNQLNLTFLVIRFLHLTANTMNPYFFPIFDTMFCKLANYCLLASTRITYWLSSLIAIERLYVVVYINGRWLNSPHIARRINFIVMITILFVSAYELIFIRSEISGGDDKSVACVMIFPVTTPTWKYLHNVVVVIDSLVPLLINLVCTVGITCIITKKKMNANAQSISVSMVTTTAVKSRETSNVQQTLTTGKYLDFLPLHRYTIYF